MDASDFDLLLIRNHLDLSCSYLKELIEERVKAFNLTGIGLNLDRIGQQIRIYCRLASLAGDSLSEVSRDDAASVVRQIRDCRAACHAEVDRISAAWSSLPCSDEVPDSPEGIKRYYPVAKDPARRHLLGDEVVMSDGRTTKAIAQDLEAAVMHAIDALHLTLTSHAGLLGDEYLAWAEEIGLPNHEPA